MEQQIEQARITYLMHESDMARADQRNKRLWFTNNILIAAMAAGFVIGVINASKQRNIN